MVDIIISSNTYFAYSSVEDADEYLIPDINYPFWSALTTDQKSARLVQGARLLDSLSYIEEADTQTKRESIAAFATANILIASLLSTGSTAILGSSVEEAQTKRLQAEVEIEYFRSNSFYFPSAYSNWPSNIFVLIRPYLKSLTGFGGATSFGTSGENPISDYSILND